MNLRLLTLLCLTASFCAAPAASLIIPVFGNNSAQFKGALAAARQSNLIAIINPNDGVSGSVQGNTASFSRKIVSAGSLSAGYINTNYGRRGIDSIRGDINKYRDSYGANAIFLDEFSDSAADISTYREIYQFAKSNGLKVIGNPGTFVPRGYADVTDVLITYEDSYAAGFSRFKQKSWTKKYSKKKFGVIVNSTSNYKAVLSKANQQNVEYVFSTDVTEPSPYGRLPSNFNEQASATRTRGLSASAVPEAGTAVLLLGSCLGFFQRRSRHRLW